MSSSEQSLLIVCLTCIFLRYQVCEAEQNETTSEADQPYSKSHLSIVTQDIEKFTMWSVHCDTETQIPPVECVLIFHSDTNHVNFTKPLECRFYLHPTSTDSVVAIEYIRAYRILDSNFLVSWIDYNPKTRYRTLQADDTLTYVGMFLNFIMIPMSNCADMTASKTQGSEFEYQQMDHHFLMKNHEIVLRKDSFDVFYVYTKDFEWAQERFNITGRRIFGPVTNTSFQFGRGGFAIDQYPRASGEIIQNREKFRIRSVCHRRVPCKIHEMNSNRSALSTANGYISVCSKSKPNNNSESFLVSTWRCNRRINNTGTNFVMKFNFEPVHLMISNLQNELIVAVTSQKMLDGGLEVSMKVFKVDGTPYKSVIFDMLQEIPISISGHVFENEQNDICMSVLWANSTHHNNKIECYRRDELLVS
ncbi:hypothetical protein QAD02_010787 [Eretmocerus hayati]|uniref:Uncharacterized protein n=1 Tax=Eretmocerus hayati TaxID=131215 RepID=A0ACC2NW14_9HYME|nr:hypothetical protein QAD02_010787 [Eretmocerus hayati]